PALQGAVTSAARMARGGAVTELVSGAGGDEEAGAPLGARRSQELPEGVGISPESDALFCRIDLKVEDARVSRKGPGGSVGIGPRPSLPEPKDPLAAADGDHLPVPMHHQVDAGVRKKPPDDGTDPHGGTDRIENRQLFVGSHHKVVFVRLQAGTRGKEAEAFQDLFQPDLMAFVLFDRDMAAVPHQDEDVAVEGPLPAAEGGEEVGQPAVDFQEMTPVAL